MDTEPNLEEPAPEEFEAELKVEPRGILYEKPQAQYLLAPLLVALACLLASLLLWFSEGYGDLLWASGKTVFTAKEYWRPFTALFAHANVEHLLLNLPFLVVFAWLLRSYFGLIAFPVVSILVGALANVATLYFYPDYVRLIGASGMVYSVVAMWVVFYLRYEIRYRLGKKILRVVGSLLVLLFPSAYSPTTSYLAHVFGFTLGAIAAASLILLGPYEKRQRELK